MNKDYDISNATNIFGDMSFYDAVETLEEFGVKVKDTDGNFRFLSEILDDISKVWRMTCRPSLSSKICQASQCLVCSFETMKYCEQKDTALDDFLNQFVRSDAYANA